MNKFQQEAIDQLKNRYSCRQFSKEKIEQEILDNIIEVGLAAASGGNLQPISVIQVREIEKKNKIKDLCKQGFIAEADTLLIYLIDYHRLKQWAILEAAPFGRQNSFADFIIALEDLMCVAQSIEIAATLMNIGSVYIGTVNYYYQELKELLNLPKLTIPVLMSCFGKPKIEDPQKHLQGHLRNKLKKEVIVHKESYQEMSESDIKESIVKDKYDSWLLKLQGDALETYKKELFEIAESVNGKDWAVKVENKIEEQKGLNRAQYRLGYHYNPVTLRSFNSKIIKFYKDQGFNFWTADNE